MVRKQGDRLVLELTGSIKLMFFALGFLSVGGALVLIFNHFVIGIAAALAALFFFHLHSRTETGYLLDAERQQLLFTRSILDHKSVTVVANFADIFAVTTSAASRPWSLLVRNTKGRGGVGDDRWWNVGVLVLRNGKVVRFTDYRDNPETANGEARSLSQALDVPYVDAPPASVLTVLRNPTGEPLLSYGKLTPRWVWQLVGVGALLVSQLGWVYLHGGSFSDFLEKIFRH